MNKEYTIAIDLGGTFVKLGLLKPGLLLAEKRLEALSSNGLKALLPGIENTISQLLEESKIESDQILGIGLSFAGLVDPDQNRIISTNQKYNDGPETDLVAWAREKWGWPLYAMNDARMALLGEWKHGAGQGYDDIVMVTIGTGIGSAVLLNGNILLGKHFQAGNLGGHFTVNHKGSQCTCGNIGCVEAEASTWRLPSLVQQHPGYKSSSLVEEQTIDFKALFAHAASGDKTAGDILEHCISAWAAGIISFIHAFDPEMIILAGGIIKSAPLFMPKIQEIIDRHAWTPWGKVKLAVAINSDTAALYGGDYLVRNKLNK
jgi:glucokinase